MTIWPTSIPLPFLDFSGAPRHTSLQSSADNGLVARRSRFVQTPASLQVTWVLDRDQFEAFQSFFDDTLADGTNLFELELLYPKNTELTEWVVRFLDGYETRWEDGIWIVRAELDLIRVTALDPVALPEGAGSFYVVSEDTGEDPQLFFTVDGVAFIAKGEDE